MADICSLMVFKVARCTLYSARLAVLSCSIAAGTSACAMSASQTQTQQQPPGGTIQPGSVRQTLLGQPPVRFEPPRLDLGTLAPGETSSGTVIIHNVSEKWLTIRESRSSCTCTAVNLANTTIAPGQALTFDVSYHAASSTGVKNNAVRILFDGYDVIEVPVVALVSYAVATDPNYIDALQKADGTRITSGEIRLHALDGKPFRVLAVNGKPPVFGDETHRSDSPLNAYVLRWDLSGYNWQNGCRNEAGERMPGWIVIETDHPGAPIVDLEVRHECNLRKPLAAMDTWAASEKRAVLGVVKPGVPVEIEVLLRYLPRREREHPPTAVVSESSQFTAELVGVERQEEGFLAKIRITPSADAQGLIYGALRLHSSRQNAPLQIIATARSGT